MTSNESENDSDIYSHISGLSSTTNKMGFSPEILLLSILSSADSVSWLLFCSFSSESV